MEVQRISNTQFKAKLIPGTSGGIGNKKLLNMFEKKTIQYPDYTLLQEKLNYSGKDTFYLLNKENERIVSTNYPHSCYSYSCVEEVADKYVEVFKKLIKDFAG